MVVNLTNHPHEQWSPTQKLAAQKWGDIVDLAFPFVSPDASYDDVQVLARNCFHKIQALAPECVICQGEMTLTYALVSLLKHAGFFVVAACSERHVTEEVMEDQSTRKTAYFQFVTFRPY